MGLVSSFGPKSPAQCSGCAGFVSEALLVTAQEGNSCPGAFLVCSDITAQPFLAEEPPLSSCRGEMCVQGCRARPKALRGLEEQTGAHWPPLVTPNAKGKVSPYRVWTQIWVSPPPQVSGVHTPAGWWILSSPQSPAPTPHSLGRTFSSRAAE